MICLLQGQNADRTGKTLFISRRTVESHLDNVKGKLGCKSKAEMIELLLNNGFDQYKRFYVDPAHIPRLKLAQ